MAQPRFAHAVVLISCMLAGAALAQTVAQTRERVEVTGSSIKRIEGETGLPVQIITREEIDRVGATSTEELLKHVTAITSFGSILTTQANGTITTSQSTISLRALGSTRTLVLINGRRVAVFGGTASTAVDVNSIPLSAVERIEVLKEGASSLYGSDAIAGVVNFILRRDYHGAEVVASYGAPEKSGGGRTWRASAFAGFGDLARDRFNVTFGAGYEKTTELMGSSRPFARNINVGENNDLSSTIAFPGNILFGPTFGRLASPAFPNCGPTGIVSPFFANSATSGRACRFENSPFLSLQSGAKTSHAILNARYVFSPAAEMYFESGFTRNEVGYTTQPVPLSEATALPPNNPYNAFLANLIATRYPNLPAGLRRFVTLGNALILLPPTSPFFPTSFVASLGLPTDQPIAIRYRDFANGLRHTSDDSDNLRLLVGMKGTIGAWDYDSGASYSQSKAASNLLSGYPRFSLFLPILDSGVINPFGPTTDPAALAAAQAAEFRGAIYTSKTSTTGLDAKATRELMQLRAGPIQLAVGAELREERFSYSPSDAFSIGDIGGFGGAILGVSAKRHIESAYTEVALPVLRSLEATVGVRYDHYERVGSTTNPKLALRFQPTPQLLLRGSVGSGFRAPSLTDLFSPQSRSVTPNATRDPIRCPDPATGLASDCNNQFPTIIGGNPDLHPEKSLSRTLGVVFEPNQTFSIAADAFWISLKDSFGALGSGFLLANVANATQFAQFIVRGAPDGNPSGAGPILAVVQTTANLFKQRVSGVDVSLNARPVVSGSTRVVLRLDGTYLIHFDQQNPDGSYTSGLDRALRAGGGVVPRWKHTAEAVFRTGPWEASVLQNYQKSYQDQLSNFNPAPRRVGSYETFDVYLGYYGIKSLRLVGGVKNIFDRDPPYTNAGGQFIAGYDVTYADPRGRFYYGTVRYTFR